MVSNSDPGEDTSDGRFKRKRKQKPNNSKFTIKIENDVKVEKVEPIDDAYMVQCSPPPSPIEAIGAIKSESESDSEVCNKYDLDCAKQEIKSEDEECAKKSCCSSGDVSNQRKDDNRNDGNRFHPEQNKLNGEGQSGRNSKGKKRRGAKKENTSKDAKKSAVKKEKKYKCHVCDYAASWKISLIRHIRRHTGEKPFVCEICAKAFTQKNHLNRHKKVHANEFSFHCPKCRRGFEQEVEKIKHENQCQHRQYQCIVCKYTTDNLSSLKKHMLIHSDEKPFQYRVCSKTFKRKYHFCQHLRIHTKQLPFACSKCGHRFAVEIDKQSHEDRCKCRRYECHICPHKCFKKSHLKYHMQSKHTGEKQFQCKMCDKKFVLKCQLKKHLATHAKPRPNRCIKYCRRFANEGDKNEHEEQCNRRHYECYICKVLVRDSMQLRGHMRNRSYR
ncbi:zinc finger protein 287-like [Contarinia nasturtii]|uniref:zinc finger protein 287-like n=1 Tax=Contarinia nasturtii TaxID=265458 RepID=UPI0012D3B7CC|nr:zinc finger protein 287-like [Contarinia nasturtii]